MNYLKSIQQHRTQSMNSVFFFIIIQRGFANAIRDNDVFEMFVLYIIKLNFNISSVSSAAAACRRVGEEDEGTG